VKTIVADVGALTEAGRGTPRISLRRRQTWNIAAAFIAFILGWVHVREIPLARAASCGGLDGANRFAGEEMQFRQMGVLAVAAGVLG
jgi:hypothetical protein